ncbi:Uncharacterized protein FWK35_00030969 [Aphis craccivora]|uniref:Uncharacterized protein n=1 Tax=Aphis craccivora TaxID=307492 RepID=A0A6G0YH48_APHCR|nr:Uncharacterized protein FWK35_00030969 [Aphis craccivora]
MYFLQLNVYLNILDPTQSDKCIDFTMMWFFFVCKLYIITSRNNASISKLQWWFSIAI